MPGLQLRQKRVGGRRLLCLECITWLPLKPDVKIEVGVIYREPASPAFKELLSTLFA